MTPSEMICFALYSASHAMQRAYAPLLDPHGLTYPQYLVLVTLWSQDAQAVGQIARALQLESNTLTPLLKRMEATGLITRTRSTHDERQVIIALTEQGRGLQSALSHIPTCIGERSGIDLPGLLALKDQVTTLRDNLATAQAAASATVASASDTSPAATGSNRA
jgi:DNA-binding MarR family transcriptional regulator